jgi:LTXXQ motif family protein
MMRPILLACAALAAWTLAVPARAASDQSSAPAMERMQNWAADHEALLDAHLAGLRAGLKLTPDQDKLWAPFETAVRDAAKLRMDQMKSMIDRMRKMREMMTQGAPGEAVSPVERLEALGRGLSERGAAIEKVADAAKPLYASLDDAQKRRFVLLGRELVMHQRMDMMRGMGGAMGREGAGHDSDSTERPGRERDDQEDNSDDE